ncbi:MAG: putative DNA binding domain-containing protein [Firmicutes bacterium]|nr:putative DNA binding domain-containing protein [Bacillota bacterium]
MISEENMTVNEFEEYIKKTRENYQLEYKESSGSLPKSFWETYSAFSNTKGGYIILGVAEDYPENKIVGVNNHNEITKNLWDLLSNKEKVSYSTINNEDVSCININEKIIVSIKVNEAPDSNKPVYLKNNFHNSYIRTGDGDRMISDNELKMLFRNSNPESDFSLLDRFTIEDLDELSVVSFKEKVSARNPSKGYTKLNIEEFLLNIGAVTKNRETGNIQIKRGTLLFLGKYTSIREVYPYYHLDYFNRKENNLRWIDRVATDEPNEYEMNIFNFYNIVSEKLKLVLKEAFQLDDGNERVGVSDFDESIREALVNCLVHADYLNEHPSTKIEVFDGWFHFVNPGKMLVSIEKFTSGGDSRPRNETIMTMFRHLGVAERQGFGGWQIFSSAVKNKYRIPEIESDLEKTDLKIWNIDLADAYPELSKNEKLVYSCIVKSLGAISQKEIQTCTKLSEHHTRKAIRSLIKSNHVQIIGGGKTTAYLPKIGTAESVMHIQLMLEQLQKKRK